MFWRPTSLAETVGWLWLWILASIIPGHSSQRFKWMFGYRLRVMAVSTAYSVLFAVGQAIEGAWVIRFFGVLDLCCIGAENLDNNSCGPFLSSGCAVQSVL